MRSVRASGKPMRAAKCEKSSPIARVAEVNTQAQGRAFDVFAQPLRDLERRELQRANRWAVTSTQRKPAVVRQFAQDGQRVGKSGAAPRTVRECLRLRPTPQVRCDAAERGLDLGQSVEKAIRQIRPFVAPCPRGNAARKSSSDASTDATAAAMSGSLHRSGRQFAVDVPHQQLRLPHRPDLAEELRRDIRHLMRFVENHGLGARQQIAEALVFEREIGQQQMMIHDHDVGCLRVAPRLEHMAARELRALLP